MMVLVVYSLVNLDVQHSNLQLQLLTARASRKEEKSQRMQ